MCDDDILRVWSVVEGKLPEDAATLDELKEFQELVFDVIAYKYSNTTTNLNEVIH